MRILQICHKVPFPPKDGGCIAMNQLTMGMIAEGHQVKVLAVNTPKHFTDIEKLPEDYRSKTNIEAVFIDTKVKAIPAFLNLFSSASYNISRFYSKSFEKKLIQLLSEEQYDIVLLESLFVSMYSPVIKERTKARIVFRAHNIEHKLWERNALASSNSLKKIYFKILAKRLKKYEESSLDFFDAIAAITKEDAAWFKDEKFSGPVKVIPFGIDIDKILSEKETSSESLSIFHLGAMDWQPNVEGVNWFLNNVWEKINEIYPDMKLYLAGRKMSGDLKNLNKKNVIIVGEVKDAHLFMRSKGLMIAPLLSGGGMRVKIIEGMALGKVIVTTTVGAEGINYSNGKNIIIADDPKGFVDAVSKYVLSDDHLSDIGKNAKTLASEQYNNADISRDLTGLFNSIRKAI